jgi:cobaltochelatase CobS
MPRTFTAQYPGICAKCDGRIEAGQAITWARRGAKGIFHANCSTVTTTIRKDVDVENPFTLEPPPRSNLFTEQITEQSYTPKPPKPNHHAPTVAPPSDPTGVFAGLAAMIQPFIKAATVALADQIDAQIKTLRTETVSLIELALANAMKQVPVTRIELYSPETKETKTIDGQHERFPVLLNLIMRRKHVYLFGGPGSGKSTAAHVVATELGLEYGYVALTAQTGESKLFGYMDAMGVYQSTKFYECYTKGGVFCIDEADNASANLLTALNGALANGHGAFPNGNQARHPDFVCVATGNTSGWGANPMFPERRPMDAAFRRRFAFISWEYDEAFETRLTLARNPKAQTWIDWVQKVRKYCSATYPKMMVTPSACLDGADLLGSMTFEEMAHMLVFKGFDKDSVSRILSANPLPKGGK